MSRASVTCRHLAFASSSHPLHQPHGVDRGRATAKGSDQSRPLRRPGEGRSRGQERATVTTGAPAGKQREGPTQHPAAQSHFLPCPLTPLTLSFLPALLPLPAGGHTSQSIRFKGETVTPSTAPPGHLGSHTEILGHPATQHRALPRLPPRPARSRPGHTRTHAKCKFSRPFHLRLDPEARGRGMKRVPPCQGSRSTLDCS